jgi:hypothetical protein
MAKKLTLNASTSVFIPRTALWGRPLYHWTGGGQLIDMNVLMRSIESLPFRRRRLIQLL